MNSLSFCPLSGWSPPLWSLHFSFFQISGALVSSRHSRGACTCHSSPLALSPRQHVTLTHKTLLTECYSNVGNAALFRIILTSITYRRRLLLHKDEERRWCNRLWLSTYLVSAPRTPKQTSHSSLTWVLKSKSAQWRHARHLEGRLTLFGKRLPGGGANVDALL